jgi:phosphatidylserine decarboxylase
MAVMQSIRDQLAPIHPAGYPFVGAFALATLILWWLWAPLGWIAFVATLWCVYFFRDPARVTPIRADLVVAPADGRVCFVGRAVPPADLGFGGAPMARISIFMSVFDCHVNRSPVEGRVVRVSYRPGLFLNADLDKASEDNERNGLVIESAAGLIGVVQIAGLIARRIVCFTQEGGRLGAGDRFGLIRFGSRLDVYLPDRASVIVGLGSRCVAGETVIAMTGADEPQRLFSRG